MPAATVAAAWPFARRVAADAPALVLLQVQRNDWAGGAPSQLVCAELQSAYDAVNEAAPDARFQVLQITKEATEPSVGGVAWDTHRANVEATACAGDSAVDGQPRAQGCAVVRTDGLWTSASARRRRARRPRRAPIRGAAAAPRAAPATASTWRTRGSSARTGSCRARRSPCPACSSATPCSGGGRPTRGSAAARRARSSRAATRPRRSP